MSKTLSKTEWWLMGDINKALKEKFLCSAQFAQDIEAIVKDDNLGYICLLYTSDAADDDLV